MAEKDTGGQSGGVNFGGAVGNIGGDVVGHDKITLGDVNKALQRLNEAIKAELSDTRSHTDRRSQAESKLAGLRQEIVKGGAADDSAIAGLLNQLLDLVPGAATAVASAFATPALGAVAGPLTRFVLARLRGE